MRHSVVITSLEEDLRGIGLLREDSQLKPAPKGDPSSNAAAKGRNVGALSDDPKEDGEDETDEAPDHKGKVPHTIPAGPAPKAMKGEGIAGMPDKVRGKGGSKGSGTPMSPPEPGPSKGGKTAPSSPQQPGPSEDVETDEEEVEGDEPQAGSGALSVQETIARIRERSTGSSKAADLIQDVYGILDGIDKSQRTESAKAFANMSIIAEMLKGGFEAYAESLEDEELAEAANALNRLSEDAAEVASAIESEDDLDDEAVETEFRTQMEALVTGLDLYSDLVESDENVEAEVQAEGDDDSDDDDDDDDDDDKKKSKDKDDSDSEGDGKPPWMKKKEEGLPGSVLVRKGKGATRPSTGAGSAVRSTPGMRLNMSKAEAYLPFGKKGMKK